VTGRIGVSVGTRGMSMAFSPGASEERQGWGVEARANIGWIKVGSIDIPAAFAVAQPGDISVTKTP
jgi:hypothetical protein